MECRDARTQLHDLRRERLDPPAREEILAHLAGCGPCRRIQTAEAVLDEVLEQRLPRHAAPDELKRRVARLSEEGLAPRVRRARRWTRLVAPALAASLAVATGSLLLDRHASHPSRDAAGLVGEAVNDHLRILASQHPLDVTSGGSHEVKPWFEGKLDFAPVVPPPEQIRDLRLEGGAVGYFLDRKAAIAVYALRRHAVTLLAFAAEGLSWPAADVALGPIRGHAASARGFNVVLWRAGDLGYALVSDVGREDLLAVASAFAPATLP